MLKFSDNFPMSQITTLQIGGPAKKFVAVKSEQELIEAIEYAKNNQMEHLVIGGGSNLLVSDEGVDSLVIKNEIVGIDVIPAKAGIHTNNNLWIPDQVGDDKVTVSVKSGTPLQELVDYTISTGLSGLQKLTGIPGTVGGAVYGNAGAYGQTISDHLTEVIVLDTSVIPVEAGIYTNNIYGSRCLKDTHSIKYGMTKEKCIFGYRDSIFKQTKQSILEVHFQLEPGDADQLRQEAEEVLTKRLVKYPPGIKCPGSFFKNLVAYEIPPEILRNIPPEKIVYGKLPAGTLLEEVGAKGQKSDGIMIASYHANLFINKKSGSAKAFYGLAKTYAQKVKEKYGITLEPEVQLINLPAFNL